MNKMSKSIKINSIDIKNRLVMPPMATSKTKDGTVNQTLLDYYDEKTKGGYIGLVITEHNYVTRQGIANSGQMSISRDTDVEGLAKLVSVIHKNGSKVIAQISHAGSSASRKVTGMETISASAILNNGLTGRNGEMPTAMSKEQIDAVVAEFVSAARRAKEAGFDGVEIHSAHGYLLNQFYSPLTNKRNDEYGFATIENRLRIHKEIIQGIRAVAGNDYLVALRLGGCDYTDGGSTIEDSVEASKLLESYGIDLLDISGGMNGYMIPGRKEPGYFSDMSKEIKKAVSLPAILTGGITDIEQANMLIENGSADLIGVGRAILKDSLWAMKAMKK